MSNQNVNAKPNYESPILVPLGEIAKGSGLCATGSAVAPTLCAAGGGDAGVIDCTAGQTAARSCTQGATAKTACTAGPVNIGGTCSAGGQANPTCTGGATPVSGCIGGTSLGG
jgi:hypothetical protein